MLPLLLPLALSLAPDIAKWLAGNKAEVVTQKAVEVVQAITGTNDPGEAASVIANDPQKSLELKVALAKIAADAEAAHANERIENLKADIANTANAREQTIALAEANSKISWAAPIISIVIVLGFFMVPFVSKYLGYTIDQIWLGALIAAFANVGNYWLGSSASGKRAQEAVQTVAQRSADQVNANSARPPPAAPLPAPVVVVPPVPVAPPPAPIPPPAVIVQPAPAPAPVVSANWKQGPYGGARWQVVPDGVLVEGEAAVARSIGEPVTIRKIWTNYGKIIAEVCGRLSVPIEVVVAVIATESKGRSDAVFVEPDGRASGGLMQVLNTTAGDLLKRTVTVEELKDPTLNINAGVTYILQQKPKTWFDPVLVAAAFNSGGLYEPRAQDNNRFNLRSTGDHLERMIRWYGDACFVAKSDKWFG